MHCIHPIPILLFKVHKATYAIPSIPAHDLMVKKVRHTYPCAAIDE